MLRDRSARRHRRHTGVAAAELLVVTVAFVMPLLIEIWEMGVYINAKQIVANAAREGARLAAQGYTILTNGTQVEINVATGTPNVATTSYEYMLGAGLTGLTNVTVNGYTATQWSANSGPQQSTAVQDNVIVVFTFTAVNSSGVLPSQPYQGTKGEPFTVYVSVPWTAVRWTSLGIISPTNVQYTASWQMLVDDTFTVNPALPSW